MKGSLGLARASFAELERERGLGLAKAAQLKAAFELGRRLMVASPEERPQIKSPAEAANLLMMEMGMLQQEHMRTILLDTKNRVLAVPTIYIGSLNSSMIRVGEVFREAIKQNCAAIIVTHNHPSGDPTPSADDLQVTTQIVEAGKLLDIEVLDHLIIGRQRYVIPVLNHLIIGRQGYVSMKERGLGFD